MSQAPEQMRKLQQIVEGLEDISRPMIEDGPDEEQEPIDIEEFQREVETIADQINDLTLDLRDIVAQIATSLGLENATRELNSEVIRPIRSVIGYDDNGSYEGLPGIIEKITEAYENKYEQ